jgi:hypothetical protein
MRAGSHGGGDDRLAVVSKARRTSRATSAGREVEYSVCDPTLRSPRMQLCRQTQRAWLPRNPGYIVAALGSLPGNGLSWRVPDTGPMR